MDLTHCAVCGAPTEGTYKCQKCAAAAVAQDFAEDAARLKAEGDRPRLPPWRFDLIGSLLRHRAYRRQVADGEK